MKCEETRQVQMPEGWIVRRLRPIQIVPGECGDDMFFGQTGQATKEFPIPNVASFADAWNKFTENATDLAEVLNAISAPCWLGNVQPTPPIAATAVPDGTVQGP